MPRNTLCLKTTIILPNWLKFVYSEKAKKLKKYSNVIFDYLLSNVNTNERFFKKFVAFLE